MTRRGSNRDLGHEAESTFSAWCARTKLRANTARVAAGGWDFLVQERASKSIDSPGLACVVQVKGTESVAEAVSWDGIKLKNWLALATIRMPAFLCVIRFGDDGPVAGELLHVGEDLIFAIIKRKYELQAVEAKDLGERKLGVDLNGAVSLRPPFGKHLRRAIASFVGNAEDYPDRKAKWLASVGYDERSLGLKFSTSGTEDDDPIMAFAETFVGLRRSLPVTNFRTYVTRFGIELPHQLRDRPDDDTTSASVSIQPTKPEIRRVRFSPTAGGPPEVALSMEVRDTAGIPNLPAQYKLLRLIAPDFEVILSSTGARWTVSPDFFRRSVSLHELESVGITCGLFASSADRPVRLELLSKDVTCQDPEFAASIRGSERPGPDSPMVKLFLLCENVSRIARAFGLPNDFRLKYEDAAEQYQPLIVMGNLLRQPRTEGPCFEVCLGEQLKVGALAGLPYVSVARLGARRLAAVLALWGPIQTRTKAKGGWTVAVRDSETRIVSTVAWTDGDEFPDLYARVADAITWMTSRKIAAILPDEYRRSED